MNILHLVGPPGAGKSTLAEQLTHGLDVAEFRFQSTPMYWLRYEPAGVVEIGRLATEEKPRRGSDRLTMNVIEYAWPWLQAYRPPLVLIEGARIEARSWYQAARSLGYQYNVVHLDAPREERLARLTARDGKPQDEKWMAGRESGSGAFAAYAGGQRLRGDVLELLERTDRVAAALSNARLRCVLLEGRLRETPPKLAERNVAPEPEQTEAF
jgi:hypothetical protein